MRNIQRQCFDSPGTVKLGLRDIAGELGCKDMSGTVQEKCKDCAVTVQGQYRESAGTLQGE